MKYSLWCSMVLLFLNLSCNRSTNIEVENPTLYFSSLISEEEKLIFKSFNFDSNSEFIKQTETAILYDATNEHLFYNFNYPKDTSLFVEYADIKYFFDKEKYLKIITVNIYLNDSIQELATLTNFIDYYNQKYGDASIDDYQYHNWGATSSRKGKGKCYYTIGLKKIENEYGITIEILRQ